MYKCNYCDRTFTHKVLLVNHLLYKHERRVLNTRSSIGSISMLNYPHSTARFKENGMYIVFNFSIYNLNN